jgi:hypothetical protein
LGIERADTRANLLLRGTVTDLLGTSLKSWGPGRFDVWVWPGVKVLIGSLRGGLLMLIGGICRKGRFKR